MGRDVNGSFQDTTVIREVMSAGKYSAIAAVGPSTIERPV
jgi:hypothetical protein